MAMSSAWCRFGATFGSPTLTAGSCKLCQSLTFIVFFCLMVKHLACSSWYSFYIHVSVFKMFFQRVFLLKQHKLYKLLALGENPQEETDAAFQRASERILEAIKAERSAALWRPSRSVVVIGAKIHEWRSNDFDLVCKIRNMDHESVKSY